MGPGITKKKEDLIVYGMNIDATWLNPSTSKVKRNAALGPAG